jgi:hypothetical protein
MLPDRDAFDALKKELATTSDFAGFWNGFIERFASQPGFMQLGGPAEVEGMEILICRITSRMLEQLVEPVNTRLIKIAEAGFVHGSCTVDGRLCCVLLFEDLEMGLLVLMSDSGKTQYTRFTLRGSSQAQ